MLKNYTEEFAQKSIIHRYISQMYIHRFDVETVRDMIEELPRELDRTGKMRVLRGPDGIYCKVQAQGVFRLSVDSTIVQNNVDDQRTQPLRITKYICADLTGKMHVYKIGKPDISSMQSRKIFTPTFAYNINKKRAYIMSYGFCPEIRYEANPYPEDIEYKLSGTRLV
jgi:hypothetical protein